MPSPIPVPDHVQKMRDQQAALKAFDTGESVPTENRFTYLIEAHRAGRHDARPLTYVCPVCARAKRANREGG